MNTVDNLWLNSDFIFTPAVTCRLLGRRCKIMKKYIWDWPLGSGSVCEAALGNGGGGHCIMQVTSCAAACWQKAKDELLELHNSSFPRRNSSELTNTVPISGVIFCGLIIFDDWQIPLVTLIKRITVQHWLGQYACSPFPIIDKEKKKIAYRDLTIFFSKLWWDIVNILAF